MLTSHDSDDSFLERPALEIAIARDGMNTDTLRRQFESALAGSESPTKDSRREFRLAAGAQLGPYAIEAPVSAGGMGEIYRASDTRLGRVVALKILASRLMGEAGMRGRFEAEARAISRLNHPHICTLYDIGRDREIDYLVMEYLEGETLASRLERGPVPYSETVSIAVEICDALAYSHAHNVIHRDLKPGNVILTPLGAKLVDFGLARWEQEAEILSAVNLAPSDSTLTVTGLILGTPQYMAPEQIERRPADPRTDIFALGAVLFEMASGRKAFAGSHASDVMCAIVSSEAPRLDGPSEFSSVVRRCLQRRPEDRWQSAGELSGALKELQHPERGIDRWRRAVLMPAVLALAALSPGDRPAPAPQIFIRRDTILRTISDFPARVDTQLSGPNGIISGPNGLVYGTAWQFGGPKWSGSVFELEPPEREGGLWRRSILYAFSGGHDGANPVSLIAGKKGELYGITSWGGNGGNGTVFELAPPSAPGGVWTENVIHHFTRVNGDGCNPTGALALGPDGQIYGTTQNGGMPGQGRGIAYELSPPGNGETAWTMHVLHTFRDSADGTNPEGGLVLGPDGALYGTTGWGSGLSCLVFKLVPGAGPASEWKEIVLHRIVYEEGHGRNANMLTFGPDGTIYGSTQQIRGSIFELSPTSAGQAWRESLLHSFIGAFGEGSAVIGGVTVGSNGNLYALSTDPDTVFQLSPPPVHGGPWVETVLRSFAAPDHLAQSNAALPMVMVDAHTLLGTMSHGGPLQGGAVFQLKF